MERVQALDHLVLMFFPVQGALTLLKLVPHPEALEGPEIPVGRNP
jgi:hypothetical protein